MCVYMCVSLSLLYIYIYMSLSLYIYIYIFIYICRYIYIYIERERGTYIGLQRLGHCCSYGGTCPREGRVSICLSKLYTYTDAYTCTCTCTYTYTCTCTYLLFVRVIDYVLYVFVCFTRPREAPGKRRGPPPKKCVLAFVVFRARRQFRPRA